MNVQTYTNVEKVRLLPYERRNIQKIRLIPYEHIKEMITVTNTRLPCNAVCVHSIINFLTIQN